MFAGRLFAVRLLLADQRVQFAEMFFFLPFFCLEEEVHFSYDISSDRLTDVFFLCHSKNKPPAMQGEDRSLDISMNSCAKIKVGLQNHK